MLQSVQRKIEKAGFHIGFRFYRKIEAPPVPVHIQLEPVVRCNLHCISCVRDNVIDAYPKRDLTLEDVDRIISLFPRMQSVKLQGFGEPFLHRQIGRIFKNLRKETLKYGLFQTAHC